MRLAAGRQSDAPDADDVLVQPCASNLQRLQNPLTLVKTYRLDTHGVFAVAQLLPTEMIALVSSDQSAGPVSYFLWPVLLSCFTMRRRAASYVLTLALD